MSTCSSESENDSLSLFVVIISGDSIIFLPWSEGLAAGLSGFETSKDSNNADT